MVTAIEAFLANPFVGLAGAIVLTVVGWKLNADASDWLLAMAWFLATISLFRIPLVQRQVLIARVLWTMFGASLIGLGLHQIATWNPLRTEATAAPPVSAENHAAAAPAPPPQARPTVPKPGSGTSEPESQRRQKVLRRLREEYILSHDGLSAALLAGIEQPPMEWTNGRLKELGEKWTVGEPKKELPDVALRLVYPKSPALIITNLSSAIAREIKYSVVLWNMDLPDRNDPLPIPVATFDWLKPHTEGGPQNLFGSPQVAALLNPGNRLFGCATVNCPECSSGNTFAVYIVWGEGGWFSEIKSAAGDLIVPTNFTKPNREAYFNQLEAMIPAASRITIEGSPLKPFATPISQ